MSEVDRALGRGFGDEAARAAARVTQGAAGEGLLDVAYAEVASPLGSLLVAATPRGLVRLAYPDEGTDAVLMELASRVSPRVLEAPGALDEVRRELDEYFGGRRRRFEMPVDLELARGFSRRVLRAAARIPYGRVSTYRQVASRAGSPRASRAAGNALGRNPVPVVVPCHRVVHSGGGLGGYTGGLDRKRFLLRLEGAPAAV
ncbi:MAG: methylated-DNA--[protein]-cysteine S-methyltransferase [Actinomycetota bacterium]